MKDKDTPNQAATHMAQAGNSLLKHKNKGSSEKDGSGNDAPRSAHEMSTDLVATGIAAGGVGMATPDETLGPPSSRNGAVVLGVVVGLLTALRTMPRRRVK